MKSGDKDGGGVIRRLGMWPRLGIVLTLFWMMGGTTYFSVKSTNDRYATYEAFRDLCERLNTSLPADKKSDCYAEWNADLDRLHVGPIWRDSAGIAALLAGLVWLVIGVLYAAVRFVLAGRKQQRGL